MGDPVIKSPVIPASPGVTENQPPADAAEGAASLTQAEVDTKTAIAAGIDYKSTFTMRQALASYNATRVTGVMNGEVITAESQHVLRDEAWHSKHAGDFAFRQPGFYDELALRTRTHELQRGVPVDHLTMAMLEATAACELMLTAKPDWFDLSKPIDEFTPLLAYHWYTQWQSRFRSGR